MRVSDGNKQYSVTVQLSVTDVKFDLDKANDYDANKNEIIEESEARAALGDYLFSGTVSESEMRTILRLYLGL